jgi:hypothetical protein
MNIDMTFLLGPVSLAKLDGKDWGTLRTEWEALRSQIVAGDELWEYRTPYHLQKVLALEFGIALKRGRKIVAHIALPKT